MKKLNFKKEDLEFCEASKHLVHCKKEPYDIYIGRPSKWGNPFKIGIDGDRLTVINKFRRYILNKPGLLKDIKEELYNKVLGCWCAPEACHGEVLLNILYEYNLKKDQFEVFIEKDDDYLIFNKEEYIKYKETKDAKKETI